MELVVWIALAVGVFAGNNDIQHSNTVFKTLAECEAVQAVFEPMASADPELAALGLTCAQVTIKAKPAPVKPSAPAAPPPKTTES